MTNWLQPAVQNNAENLLLRHFVFNFASSIEFKGVKFFFRRDNWKKNFSIGFLKTLYELEMRSFFGAVKKKKILLESGWFAIGLLVAHAVALVSPDQSWHKGS